MERITEQRPEWVLYVFDEQEFKDKLGITDSGAVLSVERDIYKNKIKVRMIMP